MCRFRTGLQWIKLTVTYRRQKHILQKHFDDTQHELKHSDKPLKFIRFA